MYIYLRKSSVTKCQVETQNCDQRAFALPISGCHSPCLSDLNTFLMNIVSVKKDELIGQIMIHDHLHHFVIKALEKILVLFLDSKIRMCRVP